MTNEEADRLPEGLCRVIWNDAHRNSLGLVMGPARARDIGDPISDPTRRLATERTITLTGAWDTRNPWPRVERVERILACDTPNQCEVRKGLLSLAGHTAKRLALADKIGENASLIRDLFLEGRDVEALAALTTELGMMQLASRQPPLRDLIRRGDPVVVVAYGRVLEVSSGHGRCYQVSLYSEGLGYGLQPGGQDPRSVWVEPDEVRYSVPPADLHGRLSPSLWNALDAPGDPPTALSRTLEAFELLSDGERMSVLQSCCIGCGVMYRNCDCAKRAQEGTA